MRMTPMQLRMMKLATTYHLKRGSGSLIYSDIQGQLLKQRKMLLMWVLVFLISVFLFDSSLFFFLFSENH